MNININLFSLGIFVGLCIFLFFYILIPKVYDYILKYYNKTKNKNNKGDIK